MYLQLASKHEPRVITLMENLPLTKKGSSLTICTNCTDSHAVKLQDSHATQNAAKPRLCSSSVTSDRQWPCCLQDKIWHLQVFLPQVGHKKDYRFYLDLNKTSNYEKQILMSFLLAPPFTFSEHYFNFIHGVFHTTLEPDLNVLAMQ